MRCCTDNVGHVFFIKSESGLFTMYGACDGKLLRIAYSRCQRMLSSVNLHAFTNKLLFDLFKEKLVSSFKRG